MTPRRRPLAICGASAATAAEEAAAEAAGRRLALAGAAVLCGGLGGVMAAAARGVRAAGGLSIGVLPGADDAGAAPDLDVVLPTGMGEMRNALIVRAAAGVLAVGGGYGTLSEIALARRIGRPVALLDSWRLQPPRDPAADAWLRAFGGVDEAVDWLLAVTAT